MEEHPSRTEDLMEEYPSNSKSKKIAGHVDEPVKKIERVVVGEVRRRKKPFHKKFKEVFIGGDFKSVSNYILLDVLLPAVKDTVADAMTQGVERMLWGEVRSSNRSRSGRRGMQGNSHVSYHKPQSRFTPNRGEELRSPSRRSRATHDFDEIILPTRSDAEAVIDQLFTLVSKYETATVADLYELVGVTGQYTDEKYGWSDIRGAGVIRINNGYLLDLPKPELLD